MSSTQVQGAQVVSRIAALLRFVGRRAEGTSLSEVVRATGLTRPTAHRLLTALTVEGMLDHQRTTKTWSLGPEFHVMASVAAAQFPIGDIVLISLVMDFSGLVLAEAVLSYVGVGVDPAMIMKGRHSFLLGGSIPPGRRGSGGSVLGTGLRVPSAGPRG